LHVIQLISFFPCQTANLYPIWSDCIGGLAEPGGSLAYTWKDGSHEVQVASLKGREMYALVHYHPLSWKNCMLVTYHTTMQVLFSFDKPYP
jgi:hypothetical protein